MCTLVQWYETEHLPDALAAFGCGFLHAYGLTETSGVVTALPGFHRVMRKVLRTPEEGADTIVWLAVATEAARSRGKLWLDREPHSTHLLSRTRERSGEREALHDWLQEYRPPKPRTRAKRKSKQRAGG